MNTVGIFNYTNFIELGITYFHSFSVVIGIILGFAKLFSKDDFKKSYGTVLCSFAFFLILNNGILFGQGNLRTENKITFGSYYGLVLYSISAVCVCFSYVLETLDHPWNYCKRLLSMIPVSILFSYLIPELYFVSFIDILGFGISVFTTAWFFRNILISKKPIVSFNLPLISLLISICFGLDLFGTILDRKVFFFIAELLAGSVLCYIFILERACPLLFDRSTTTNTVSEPKEPPISEEIQEEIKFQGRNLLEGVDLKTVEIKLNHFLEAKRFKDEELRLPDFAADLGLSTHQASYYLNKYLSKRYTDFLNFHRINEVMIMMKEKSNFNLLNIALECGFNSPSSFHRACIRFTGKSPRDLKKELQLNSNKEVDS
ncbi:DNA-binding helix-turn-helix protein [Leptospira weilii str. 2006001853]|uniref:DNA-binding helix-turn-helix protein n=1 Tax=Leptospira weilii str. 2006001853 TaxID=1001589 RepID=A0A828Z1X7_9LEPT|nr:AraC family transcriptional regulator [Leptospira weilii]EKR64986.1 DNA-binding helix-turn-helix protein [Leptospira weilii str. 2006001853]EMN45122.1 DNA-binding helix-turn-helix protein [Leptospira weilii str. LNT 1234]